MKTRRLFLKEEEILTIKESLVKHREGLTGIRLNAVLLYGTGAPVEEIQGSLKCSRSSLMNWCQIYRMQGVTGLIDGRRGGNNARLSRQEVEELTQRLKQSTPWMVFGDNSATREGKYWTAKDLYKAIKLWYGVTYQSRSSYYNLLERMEISSTGPTGNHKVGSNAGD